MHTISRQPPKRIRLRSPGASESRGPKSGTQIIQIYLMKPARLSATESRQNGGSVRPREGFRDHESIVG